VFKRKYSEAFKTLVDRDLKRGDGFEVTELAKSEKRLKLKLPLAFREYTNSPENYQSTQSTIFFIVQAS